MAAGKGKNSKAAIKRRGPAPKGDYAGKAKTINTRATPELREWLEKAAKRSGRSLSQEIETRLRSTFRDESDLAARFGSERAARVFQVVAMVLNTMRNPENPDADWLDDPQAFELGMEAVYHTLYALKPKGETDPWISYGLRGSVDPDEASHAMWRDIDNSDAALPLDEKLPFEQWRLRFIKNKIPDLVTRAGEVSGPRHEWIGDDGEIYQSEIRVKK